MCMVAFLYDQWQETKTQYDISSKNKENVSVFEEVYHTVFRIFSHYEAIFIP